jgi:hypothetical protein
LTIGQKAERVLQLLLGLRKNKVAAALVAHGFSDEDLEEGWELMRRLTRTRLGAVTAVEAADPGLIPQIDQWENKWFPIADATLKRRAPDVHAWMFRNLTQTEGPAVVVSVSTFVERWENLSKSKAKGGPEAGGEAAKKLLEKRGLTKAVIDQAKDLLKRAGKVEKASAEDESGTQENFEQAEADLWAWYLEWSVIAQQVITNRRLLRELGFLRTSGGKEKDDDEDDDDNAGDEEPPAAAAGARAKTPKDG